MFATLKTVRLLVTSREAYTIRLAQDAADVRRAQALRFAVFNVELKEGLESSAASGLDCDSFDVICDHLLVEHRVTGEVVGTYRLQTGKRAVSNRGYYSEQEFDFRPYESLRNEIIELGRACVQEDHRNLIVLGLLWKGIADYARAQGGRYLMGCSSITSQEATVGASAYAELCRHHLVSPEWRTRPKAVFECSLSRLEEEAPKIPKLLRAYLSLGAKICGPPALDRQFKTIDFLTFLDLESLPATVRQRFLS